MARVQPANPGDLAGTVLAGSHGVSERERSSYYSSQESCKEPVRVQPCTWHVKDKAKQGCKGNALSTYEKECGEVKHTALAADQPPAVVPCTTVCRPRATEMDMGTKPYALHRARETFKSFQINLLGPNRPLGHKIGGMSGLEPGTSRLRVAHSAATPRDPTGIATPFPPCCYIQTHLSRSSLYHIGRFLRFIHPAKEVWWRLPSIALYLPKSDTHLLYYRGRSEEIRGTDTRSVACQDSNPGPLGSEPRTLPLRHTTPYTGPYYKNSTNAFPYSATYSTDLAYQACQALRLISCVRAISGAGSPPSSPGGPDGCSNVDFSQMHHNPGYCRLNALLRSTNPYRMLETCQCSVLEYESNSLDAASRSRGAAASLPGLLKLRGCAGKIKINPPGSAEPDIHENEILTSTRCFRTSCRQEEEQRAALTGILPGKEEMIFPSSIVGSMWSTVVSDPVSGPSGLEFKAHSLNKYIAGKGRSP
ncbi:hypothetical protein Bbelb_057790 [Branchiostoma belcheri]|nr:hypothetical protein Bbelb_057790 [Branchiostoma belcheri]